MQTATLCAFTLWVLSTMGQPYNFVKGHGNLVMRQAVRQEIYPRNPPEDHDDDSTPNEVSFSSLFEISTRKHELLRRGSGQSRSQSPGPSKGDKAKTVDKAKPVDKASIINAKSHILGDDILGRQRKQTSDLQSKVFHHLQRATYWKDRRQEYAQKMTNAAIAGGHSSDPRVKALIARRNWMSAMDKIHLRKAAQTNEDFHKSLATASEMWNGGLKTTDDYETRENVKQSKEKGQSMASTAGERTSFAPWYKAQHGDQVARIRANRPYKRK